MERHSLQQPVLLLAQKLLLLRQVLRRWLTFRQGDVFVRHGDASSFYG